MPITVLFFLFLGFTVQAQQGLKAEFFNGVDFDEFVAEKYVDNIDLSWNSVPPVAGLDPHSCSIRWTGKLKLKTSRDYIFSATVDDGIRVWLDGKLIIDQWELNDLGVFEGTIYLTAGKEYKLVVEYFNALNEGEIKLLYNIPSKEQSWYEYFFEEATTPIPPEFFFRPDEPVAQLQEKPKKVVPEKTKKKPQKPKPSKKKPMIEPNIVPAVEKLEEPVIIVTQKEAEKFIPKNIAFERGKNIILESSTNELNLFARFMVDNPQVRVKIEGHTDPVGDATKNITLSRERALKVANFLVEKGVDNKRIEAEGYGGTRPLVVPKKGEYHPANRRVVFVLSGLN